MHNLSNRKESSPAICIPTITYTFNVGLYLLPPEPDMTGVYLNRHTTLIRSLVEIWNSMNTNSYSCLSKSHEYFLTYSRERRRRKEFEDSEIWIFLSRESSQVEMTRERRRENYWVGLIHRYRKRIHAEIKKMKALDSRRIFYYFISCSISLTRIIIHSIWKSDWSKR